MRRFGAAAALAVFAVCGTALADETTASRRAEAARELNHPYAIAELSIGILSLPAAEVCPTSLNNCSQGESSLALGIRNLYRFGDFAFGAGIQWATTLRNDASRGDPSLGREHSRRYFLVEAMGRYYAFRKNDWEFWGGGTLGAVIVRDAWSELADREPYSDVDLVGPRAAVLGTEGIAAGVGFGADWTFYKNWSAGATLRYESWFLPSTRQRSPTLDVASLSGRVDMFDVYLAVAYHIAL